MHSSINDEVISNTYFSEFQQEDLQMNNQFILKNNQPN